MTAATRTRREIASAQERRLLQLAAEIADDPMAEPALAHFESCPSCSAEDAEGPCPVALKIGAVEVVP